MHMFDRWLTWDDLTDEEKRQATDSYLSIRADAEDDMDDIDVSCVECCRFERQEDGYIYVDL